MITALLAVVVAMIPACSSDDGSSDAPVCGWDAQAHGNGVGSSFIVADGTVFVIP